MIAHFRRVLSHPDKYGDGRMFKQLQQARRILRSPDAQATYDGEGLEAPLSSMPTDELTKVMLVMMQSIWSRSSTSLSLSFPDSKIRFTEFLCRRTWRGVRSLGYIPSTRLNTSFLPRNSLPGSYQMRREMTCRHTQVRTRPTNF